ncbi:MAG: hypothetical protein K0S32_2793 [Bacteroidetes bacterium]|jgi:hypothetical protein|nr:hypothetical protein [Bacteroidota bacterium]
MIPLVGVSLKLTDKQVDKMLRAHGFSTKDVFYSPIQSWIMVLIMLASAAYPLMIYAGWYSLLLVPYAIASYFLNARNSNSFAIEDEKFIVVNGNFPFRKLLVFEKNEIKNILIDTKKIRWQSLMIMIGGNYVKIETNSSTTMFYCVGLDLDAYDENWTEKTIDDLHHYLKQKEFPVEFRIED